ncbi:hypothetical protein L596_017447 [Steinernema carpocapsae]|uniref:Uncharacterized protein n=1 Tax=Steinernema carpocapsae TaxID=34508 RepID=A0A4U5N1Y9_STECR|nr:hypothetical protein L596_017447 [Steinernema carpocapsae]
MWRDDRQSHDVIPKRQVTLIYRITCFSVWHWACQKVSGAALSYHSTMYNKPIILILFLALLLLSLCDVALADCDRFCEDDEIIRATCAAGQTKVLRHCSCTEVCLS